MNRNLMLCALFLVVASVAQAQIDVTSSGGTSPATYPTLNDAFVAVNTGVHTGTITIDVTGNTTESVSAVLNASGGTSSYSSITIRPSGGSARTISGSIAGPLLDLNGADNVTIDGLNTGGNALTLENTSTAGGYGYSTGPSTIRFINDASGNTVRDVTVNGSCGTSPASQTGTIYFGGKTTGAPENVSGNDDNTVTNCDIGPAGGNLPASALWALGNTTSTTRANSGVVISNNRFHDYFYSGGGSVGIYVSSGNTGWTISGNSLYQTGARTQTGGSALTHFGIYVSNSTGADFDIVDNYVGGGDVQAGGSPWSVTGARTISFTGFYISVGSASVQNNTVANFAWSTNGDWRGIQVARGTVGLGTITGNTVGAATGSGSIFVTSGLTGKTVIGLDAASTGGSVTIANNTVGAITTSGTSTSVSTNLFGIQAGANVIAIEGNLIGSEMTPFSLQASNPSASATAQAVAGIVSGSGSAVFITGNTVANLHNAYAGTGAAGQVRGIVTTAGTNTVRANTVRNLSNASASTGTGANAAVLGIAQISTGGGTQTVAENLVHSLSGTAASAAAHAVGIYYGGPTAGAHVVARNIVHSLSLATSSTAASLTGIYGGAGAASYQNNMVRLGLDQAGNAITSAIPITGILKATTASNSFYFNSVWLGGTGVGAGVSHTYAFRRSATGVDDIRDNIFANLRQNAVAGGRHFAMALNAPTTATSDHNLYSVASGNSEIWSLDGGTTSITTLRALRLAPGYGQDSHSGLGDPNFLAPSDPASTVSLKLDDPTPAEGSGVDISAVTEDQEGELRAILSPVDIGADAGDNTMDASTDVFTPRIDYTPLVNTSLTGDRVLTAHLTDVGPPGGGIPIIGAGRPRIWYKKSTDGSWSLSSPGTLVSGDGLDGTWEFTLVAADLSPVTGDVIEYYIVAQDGGTTPNLWYNPVAADDPVHSDVATQTVPPSLTNSYAITGSLAGTYYVPNTPIGRDGEVYSSLTAANGFFAAVNAMPLSGDVTVIVNGDVGIEDGTNALGEWLEDGAGAWTLTIRPDGTVPRVLSGSAVASGSPMIPITGADRVVIDGRFDGGGRYLVFRNTNAVPSSTGPTIRFNGASSDCVLRNCILENNGSTVTSGTVQFGAAGNNTAILVADNDIRDPTGGSAGIPGNAVHGNSAGNSALTISGNEIRNWSNGGVLLPSAGGSIVVEDNSFYYELPPATTAQTAILVGGTADDHQIAGNWIGGTSPLCGGSAWESSGSVQFTGISLTASGTSSPSQVQGNTIHNIRLTGGGAAAFTGIAATSGAVAVGTTTGNTVGSATTANSIEIAGASTGIVRGISVTSGVSAQVSNNLVANITASNAAATGAFRGIELNPGTDAVSSIQNNTIRSISLAGTGASSFAGIYAIGGQLDLGGTTGNTVGAPASASSIQFSGTGASYGIYLVSSTGGQTVAQNLVANVNSAGNGSFYAIHVGVPWNSALSTITGNTVDRVALTNTGTSAQMRGISLMGAGSNPAYGAGTAIVNDNVIGHDTEPNSIVVAGGAVTSGIHIYGYVAAVIEASGNTVANILASGEGAGVSLKGLYYERGIASVTANEIHDLTSPSTSTNETLTAAVTGIYAGLGNLSLQYTDNFVDGNVIYALRSNPSTAAATVVSGIVGAGSGSYARGVARSNRIYDLANSSISPSASVRGFYQYLGTWTLANNQIALTNDPYTNALQLVGIYQGAGGYYYYNSVLIGGTQESGSADSYAFVRPTNGNPTLRNNLFYNERTNSMAGTGGHYAIANLYMNWSLWSSTSSDFNVLIAPDSAAIGRFSTTDLDFAGWRTSSGGDGNSLSEPSGTIAAASLFTDAANGNLDITPTSGYDAPPIVSNVGVPVVGQTTDFGGSDVRGTFPDIGADEILVSRTLTTTGNLQPASANYPGNYDDLALGTGGAPTLIGNISVFGTLTLGGDNVTTDVYAVTLRPSGTVVRTSGHVVGNLNKYVADGATADRTFEIGTGTDYAPVDVHLNTVTTAGYLQATTTGADHPDIATSGLDPALGVNRYWTMSNSGVGFSSYDATFNFVATDVDPSADPDAFEVRQYDAPDWLTTTTGTRTATSTQALGMTSFSDFAVGEVEGPNTAPVASDVGITGTPEVGQTLTGSYTYSDADGDLEGASTFRWLRDDVAIGGATALTYLLDAADEGTLIKFEVTPVAQSGVTPGVAVASTAVGPILSGTGVEELIATYELAQCQPNPFNPSTTIGFAIPEAGELTLRIYAVTGRLIRTVVDGQMERGRHAATWDGRDDAGATVVSGVYFCRLVARNQSGEVAFVETRKMTMMK